MSDIVFKSLLNLRVFFGNFGTFGFGFKFERLNSLIKVISLTKHFHELMFKFTFLRKIDLSFEKLGFALIYDMYFQVSENEILLVLMEDSVMNKK